MSDLDPNSAAFGAAMEFLEQHSPSVRGADGADLAARLRRLVEEHDHWRDRSLNLTPAENTLSRACRALLNSDLATRVPEGLPGAKEYPGAPQNRYIDQIEAILIELTRELFGVRHVDWRPVSTSMANAAVFAGLLSPGDTILVPSREAGGNYSYRAGGSPSILGLNVVEVPPRGDTFEVDLDACRQLARRHRPRMIVIGGSYSLFPPATRELVEISREAGARLMVDAAHTALFMACGAWPNPLREGADVLTLSTHKVMSGPVGGMVLTDDEAIARAILGLTFPVFMQTRDQNKYASTAHAFCEMRAFGADYVRQMQKNARALGEALSERGLRPLAGERGFTLSHQLVIDLAPHDARAATRSLREAGVLVTAEHLAFDVLGSPTGTRLSVQEVTRRGMREPEMRAIADFVARVVLQEEGPHVLGPEVAAFVAPFSRVAFSFDP